MCACLASCFAPWCLNSYLVRCPCAAHTAARTVAVVVSAPDSLHGYTVRQHSTESARQIEREHIADQPQITTAALPVWLERVRARLRWTGRRHATCTGCRARSDTPARRRSRHTSCRAPPQVQLRLASVLAVHGENLCSFSHYNKYFTMQYPMQTAVMVPRHRRRQHSAGGNCGVSDVPRQVACSQFLEVANLRPQARRLMF